MFTGWRPAHIHGIGHWGSCCTTTRGDAMPDGTWIFEVRALFWRLRVESWPTGPRGWALL